MLDLHRLRLLRELAIRGTITEVATALNFAPSTVSAQLSRLEQEAGTTLLVSSGRKVMLTTAALGLVEHTNDMLAIMEEATAQLVDADSIVAGTVRLSMFQTSALAVLPGTLRLLATSHPGIRLEVAQREPEQALHDTWAGDFDIVVAEQYPGHAVPQLPDMLTTPLVNDPLRLAIPANLAHDVKQLTDAAGFPWIMEPTPAASRHWALQQCRVAGFEPDIRYSSADLQAHVQLIEAGQAVAILPGMLGGYRPPQVTWVQLDTAPQRHIFLAMRRASAGHPAVAAVASAIQRHAQDATQS